MCECSPVSVSALLLGLGLGLNGCGSAAVRPVEPQRPASEAARRDVRLRDDCGGWVPSADVIDVVAGMRDAEHREMVLRDLDAGPLARKIDTLRAGLRLRDEPAARACAAHLSWKWMDGWECARAVELLRTDVLRAGAGGDFEEFRSYLGTKELPAFLAALPPLPWDRDPAQAVAHLHRVLHEDSLDAWATLAHHADPRVAAEARTTWWATVAPRCDRRREEVLRRFGRAPGTTFPTPRSPALAGGLVDELRRVYLSDGAPDAASDAAPGIDAWTRRWCLDSVPGPRDELLLIELADRHGTHGLGTVGGVATVLLGRLDGADSDAFLRGAAAADDESLAWCALAARGDRDAVDRLVAWSATARYDAEIPLAALLAADPVRGREVVESRVLGKNEALALHTLAQLEQCVVPGWTSGAMAFDLEGVSWAGFEPKARAARVPALRRAMIGFVIPGCRTRALAEAACRDLDASFFSTDLPAREIAYHPPRDDPAAFLEIGAPESFRAALRRVATSEVPDAREAAGALLLEMGDPASGARLLERAEEAPFSDAPWLLARSPSPEVVAWLMNRVRQGSLAGSLAVALGAPEGLVWPDEAPRAVANRLLARDWRAAFHAVLAAEPDEEHGTVGALGDDAMAHAYLQRLRARRDAGLYWYATGQLAAAGNAAARAEFWDALTTGRYRILNQADEFVKTLGGNLDATMPYWLEQLRSSCCRAVTSGGEPWNSLFGVEAYAAPWRTPYASAKEIWEAGTGRDSPGFVWSRVRGCYVLGAR